MQKEPDVQKPCSRLSRMNIGLSQGQCDWNGEFKGLSDKDRVLVETMQGLLNHFKHFEQWEAI